MAGSLKTEAIVLRTLRFGEADRILHLYTPHRGRVSAIAKGVRRSQQPLRRPARAVLPPQPRPLRGPQRPADGHERRDRRRRTRALRDERPRRSTPPPARATPSAGCSRRADPQPGRLPPARQRARAARRRPGAGTPRRPTSSRSASSCCSPPASRRSSAAARCAASASTSAGFSGAAGGVVCGACEGSAFPLDEEAHALHGRGARPPAGRGAARAGDRALRQAERAILETVEHHAHLRLRPALTAVELAAMAAPRRRSGSSTSPRGRGTCATCSAARARTSPR